MSDRPTKIGYVHSTLAEPAAPAAGPALHRDHRDGQGVTIAFAKVAEDGT